MNQYDHMKRIYNSDLEIEALKGKADTEDEVEFIKGMRRTEVANAQLDLDLSPAEFFRRYRAFTQSQKERKG